MNITVIGAGKSGMAAARLARKTNNNVFLTEYGKIPENKLNELNNIGIGSEEGGHTDNALANCDLIVASPGVPPSAEIIRNAEKKGLPIISELEFAYRHLDNPIIAITGTNGKTTTTALTEHVFNHSGKKAIACGNIGNPLSNLVGEVDSETVLVIEASSYQLDRISSFKPNVAMILNITPDHLSYHGSFPQYEAAKWKITSMQDDKNLLILNADDEVISGGNFSTEAGIRHFSMNPVPRGVFKRDGSLILNTKHKEEYLMAYDELSLPGLHNAYNSMAAALAARAFEITNENIRDSLMTFHGVEHRLEFVRTINGADYINDTKATNVNAAWYALSSYNKPIIWIAGGRGSDNNYSMLDELVKKNVKEIITIGEESEAIFEHFYSMVHCHRETCLEHAVYKAHDLAEFGDCVLFSPACKSFDMFANFEQRGQVFKHTVNSI